MTSTGEACWWRDDCCEHNARYLLVINARCNGKPCPGHPACTECVARVRREEPEAVLEVRTLGAAV